MKVTISYDCPESGSNQTNIYGIDHGWYFRFDLMRQLSDVVEAYKKEEKRFVQEYETVYGKKIPKTKVKE